MIESLADEIVTAGVKMSFGVPGSGVSLSLIDKLDKRGVPFYLTHFEGTGTLMAATIGRLSGCAGLSLSIKGPGLANSVPGLTAAWFEAFPVIHITEAYAFGSSPTQAHKRLEHACLAGGITKAVRYFSTNGPSFTDMALFAATEEPGPVVYELAIPPAGIQDTLPFTENVTGDQSSVMECITHSKRPVVIVGALGTRQHQIAEMLRRLAIPVFTSVAAKGILDEAISNSAGIFTGCGLELTPERQILPKADLIVGIGLTAREVLAAKPFHCNYVSIEAVATLGTNGFAPTARGGLYMVEEVFTQLAEIPAWGLDELADVMTALHARMDEGFLPGSVFHAIERQFRTDARIVLDTGYFCTIGEHAWRAPKDNLFLMSGQGRYMGTGLPMALGASLYEPTRPTIAILGDGGIAMYLAEAKLAVQHKLPLLIILMTDNAFGSIRTRALKDGLTQAPLIMDGCTWVPTFESLGFSGNRAENLSTVEAVLSTWVPASGPAFLEIPFAPDAYEAMVADIR